METIKRKDSTFTTRELYASCEQLLTNPIMRSLVLRAKNPSSLSEHLKSLGWSAETCRKARHAVLLHEKIFPGGSFYEFCHTEDRPFDHQFMVEERQLEELEYGNPKTTHIRTTDAFRMGEELDNRASWPWLLREQRLDLRNSPNTFDGITPKNDPRQSPCFRTVADPMEEEHIADSTSGKYKYERTEPRASIVMDFYWHEDNYGKLRVIQPIELQSMIVVTEPAGKTFPEYWKQLVIEKPASQEGQTDKIVIALRLEQNYAAIQRSDAVGFVKFERSYEIAEHIHAVMSVHFSIVVIDGQFILWWISHSGRFMEHIAEERMFFQPRIEDSAIKAKIGEVAIKAAEDFALITESKVLDQNTPGLLKEIAGVNMLLAPPTQLLDLFIK